MPHMTADRVTIADVARSAGVSPTTVSHALNGKGMVRASTRAHVMRTAKRLGYLPNSAARSLRSGRTATLGLMLPADDLSGIEYYLELASAAARAAFARDHGLLLLPPVHSADELRRFAVDGAIVCDPDTSDPRLGAFEALGLPTVAVDRDLGRPEEPWWIGADNVENTRAALDHLEASGAERVALLTGDASWSWLDDSVRAYRSWARERGAEPCIATAPKKLLERGAAVAAGRLLDRPDPPDAIFTPPDRFAIGVLRAAHERGLHVPCELMIAAGVDSSQARLADPPITAIDLRPGATGRAAIDMLLARIEGTPVEAPQILPAELHVRASTGGTSLVVGAH
jgi:DNA-binding LacI/PurR family transcriptional regulator